MLPIRVDVFHLCSRPNGCVPTSVQPLRTLPWPATTARWESRQRMKLSHPRLKLPQKSISGCNWPAAVWRGHGRDCGEHCASDLREQPNWNMPSVCRWHHQKRTSPACWGWCWRRLCPGASLDLVTCVIVRKKKIISSKNFLKLFYTCFRDLCFSGLQRRCGRNLPCQETQAFLNEWHCQECSEMSKLMSEFHKIKSQLFPTV